MKWDCVRKMVLGGLKFGKGSYEEKMERWRKRTMEELIEILEDIKPDVDYEGCENLIDGHYLDSLSIISLIAEIEDAFDVTVPAVEVVPANFNSVKAMWSMIERLQEEE